jgi:hypothetical protein
LDKNSGFPAGSNGAAELATKQDVTLPGKFMQVDSTNLNGTQIPDFAVGFNSNPPPSATAGTNFVPITLTLPPGAAVGATQIRFIYSASDPALSLWLVNQAKKPDAGYEQLGMSVYKKVPILPWLGPKADLSTRQRFEAFAFGVQNLGTPLGATGNLGGPFNAAAQVDLNKTPYSFGTDHSGEFDGTESWRRLYWNTLVTDFGMKPWSL